jgi:high-affinity Fe2+/Pb2+ permease
LSVRYLVTTEIGLIVAFAVGLVIAYIGIAVFISGRHQFAGVLVLGLGLWLMLYAPILHDRVHRERGEESHALWGRGDRRKPPWWPAH